MNRMIIGFAGPAGCGKSESAYMITNELYYGEVLSFATPMKSCLADLFRFKRSQLYTSEGKEAIDPRYGVSPRTLMQQFGTEFVRKVVPDLWWILMDQSIAKTTGPILIDDVRFNDEANFIRSLGGKIVHIVGRNADIENSDHKSEKGIFKLDRDITIDNSGTLSDLKTAIKSQLL